MPSSSDFRDIKATGLPKPQAVGSVSLKVYTLSSNFPSYYSLTFWFIEGYFNHRRQMKNRKSHSLVHISVFCAWAGT